MPDKIRKFFKILSIEFTDLEELFDAYMVTEKERLARKDITEYVYRENSALFAREVKDIKILKRKIEDISKESYNDLGDAKSAVIETVENFTGIPPAVHKYVKNKVSKVENYIRVL